MKDYFLSTLRLIFIICLFHCGGIGDLHAQSQTFEEAFKQVNYPQEFLLGWYANELRSSASRIFQDSGSGRNGSKSLAVQPISTFDGVIWAKVNPSLFENPTVVFFARSIRNGTGNRPAQVFYSWGKTLEGEFLEEIQIGLDTEFANENQEYRKFRIEVPIDLQAEQEIILRITIRYGPGSGSAARWMMDDFEFGDFVPDLSPPMIQEVKGYGSRSLMISFDESVDPVFSVLPFAYSLEGVNPEKVESKTDSVKVLTFGQDLDNGKRYELRVQQVPDLEGNFLQDTTIIFTFFDPTFIPEKALVINELMPAPKADQDLPNVEYLELFHAGEFEIRMEGVRLSNSRSETVLDDFWLKPREYLILAPENQAFQFAQFGEVLPVKSWPALLNSGDEIALKTNEGAIIDQISYTTSTWGGSEFSSGGFSLEVPNPTYSCANSSLLRVSLDPLKGTPGRQNSVFTSETGGLEPSLERAWFKDSLTVLLEFSGEIFPRLEKEMLAFSPALEVDSLYLLSGKELIISLKLPAKENEIFQLKVSGLQDCWKKEINEFDILNLVLASKPGAGDLLINEVLFDPRSGDPKFVELRNISRKFLNLDSWALANLDESGNPSQERVFGIRGLTIAPEGFLAITTDVNRLKTAYPKSKSGNIFQISSMPSYPIAGGTVVLLSPQKEIWEKFEYDEDLHHPLLRDPKGVSLERISPLSPTSSRSNWQSASGSEDFGTPGRKNSQSIEGEFLENLIQIAPEVFDPEGSSGPAFTSIRYELDRPGWVGSFKIYSAAGQLVHTLAQNQILGTSGIFTWTGTDSTGKRVRVGYYVLVAELYEPGGKTNVIKKTIVVATRL